MKFIFIGLLSIIIGLYGICMLNSQKSQIDPFLCELDRDKLLLTKNSFMLIECNSLIAVSSPNYISPQTLGILALMDKIIICESGGDPTAKNPKSTAYGLCQFLDGTWNYVQKKWDIKLDRYNPKDQLYACQRLLEEEGLRHWKPVWECINYDEK